MPKKSQNRRQIGNKKTRSILDQVHHANAAGIDIGSREIVIAIPADKDPEQPVRSFATDNASLKEAVQWLVKMGIRTAAFESTGNYWVALYDFLQREEIEPYVVNARQVKGVPGRKTDVQDAQWLQQLHTAGLLKASFVPAQDVLAMRYLQRHREDLVRAGGREIQHMQKAFNEMNVGLHRVISDIDGLSGRKIIEAIIAGERDPARLAKLRHSSCKTPFKEVVRALDGNFREEYILALAQSYERWQQAQRQIEQVDGKLGQMLVAFQNQQEQKPAPEIEQPSSGESAQDGHDMEIDSTKIEQKRVKQKDREPLKLLVPSRTASKRDPIYDIKAEALRIYNTDLSLIPSIGTGTLSTLLTEVGGRDAFVEKFKNGKCFASWLGLCPDNRILGNKRLGSKTRKVKSRLAYQLRMGAMTLWRNNSALGDYCRRMKARLGKAEGIAAAAHKIARIIYSLITKGGTYDDKIMDQINDSKKKIRIKNLQKLAAKLGMQIVPATAFP